MRRKFDAARLNLFSYVQTIDDDMTEAEIDAVFRQMQALQVPMFTTNQTRVGMGPRVAPFAEKYNIKAAWHPHAAGARSERGGHAGEHGKAARRCRRRLSSTSTSAITPPATTTRWRSCRHHDRITHLHIKDRKRDDGPNVQLGTGDTPIKECATLIRDNKWPIMLILEREYRDAPGTAVEQTRWQLNYVKGLLEA